MQDSAHTVVGVQQLSQELGVWEEPQKPEQIMHQALNDHDLDTLYVLYSGGQDSVCVVDWCQKNYPEQFNRGGTVFTNTGLGSQETRKFVIKYCNEKGWNLNMTWASERERFYETAMRRGFAFAGNHGMWMGYLKSHSWYYFIKERRKLGEKCAFVSGVRKKESRQRDKVKKYTRKPIDENATMIFIKPFLYKNGDQLGRYFIENGLKKTPVYSWANKSGECWCGAFANPWDLKLLELYDPLVFKTIKWLEQKMVERLAELKSEFCATDSQISTWYHSYTSENKKLRKLLSEEQIQMVCLTYFNKWGGKEGIATEDIANQTILEIFKTDDEIPVNEDYCGESCIIEV